MTKKILKNPQAIIGIVLIATMIFMALFAPVLSPHPPEEVNPANKNQGFSREYPLGTDRLGRCELSRLIYGARYSLGIALPSLFLLALVGMFIGAMTAYFGKTVDKVFVIICNIFIAFPAIMIAISLIGTFGNSITTVMISIVVSMWAWFVKMGRSFCLLESKKDYIISAKMAGCSHVRILIRHIIPNALPQFMVYVVTGVSSVILMVSGFSFLGLGLPSGTAEWGAMMNDARTSMYSNPSLIVLPGIFILMTAAGFTLFGEALRDILSMEDVTV